MCIPQDIVDCIIDQLISVTKSCNELNECLRATSLVSSPWLYPSRRRLFSVITFHEQASVQAWCSRIKPSDPEGVSRHVSVLRLEAASLDPSTIEAALPHLTSFPNLRELEVGRVRSGCPPFDISKIEPNVLVTIFSSYAKTLRRLRWTQDPSINIDPWKTLYSVTDHLPELVDIDLSGSKEDIRALPPALPRIHLSSDRPLVDPLAFKDFRFHELVVSTVFSTVPVIPSSPFLEYCKTHLRVLDLANWQLSNAFLGPPEPDKLQALLEMCYALEEFSFSFDTRWMLGFIPSSSVALVRLYQPVGCCDPTEPLRAHFAKVWAPEYQRLGASIREIAQRFSRHNPGLKTRVQVNYRPLETDARSLRNGGVPMFMTKLDEEVGAHVTLELNVEYPCVRDMEWLVSYSSCRQA